MLRIEPLPGGFGATGSGIRLSDELDNAAIAAIDAAMTKFGLLIFHDQPLEQHEQVTFAKRFGELDLGLSKAMKMTAAAAGARPRLEYDELLDISNVNAAGAVENADSRRVLSNLANQLWHSDSSFQAEKVSYSMLSAVVCPAEGGNTEFADMRAAYDALDAAIKARLAGLSAEHFAFHSRDLLGSPITDAEKAAIPPTNWPIVRRQQGTGRCSLFIGAHARSVNGMPTAQGRLLLMDLLEHATQPPFVYRHRWTVGDFVIWDNRTTLHRGRPFELTERRELRRTTILDQG